MSRSATFLPADLTGASSTNRTTGRYGRCSGTATASTWPARPAVLESIVLDDASSSQVGVRAGSAGTLLARRTEDAAGRCVEYARDVYRADRASFEVSELLGSHRLSPV
jgi:GntR family transcriptional regulator